MYVILIYDIKTDEKSPRIHRNIFKICKKYLTNVQKSVFEGELSRAEELKLKMELKPFIRKDKDSIVIFKSRSNKWLDKEFWAMEDDKTSNII
ncbi:CRISPR-associated endonuclease Cas2 [Miniphocaeibacter halophilus]|uniref:CRISPR-associated endonuclease Cas2 n=1 Tax=Miniphocaeibacter halophilus TaxID=2931922 RepID=A0AC61MTB4_9FIRM|nr:CRISPR-associated endonuclease Cas2 [Miniphocaeibacter halophilus]QQK08747.1 CRISPR-associated endonuclease Cas2 [Miniphocaeibacter halophilus]